MKNAVIFNINCIFYFAKYLIEEFKKLKDYSNKKVFNKLKDILFKKAEGYFYTEEICEYAQESIDDKKNKKVENNVSQQINFLIDDVKSECGENEKGNKKQSTNQLVLLKKKTTTHHIPPDMLAIKMLLEIYGKEMNSSEEFSTLSDSELENLKSELIKKLSE